MAIAFWDVCSEGGKDDAFFYFEIEKKFKMSIAFCIQSPLHIFLYPRFKFGLALSSIQVSLCTTTWSIMVWKF